MPDGQQVNLASLTIEPVNNSIVPDPAAVAVGAGHSIMRKLFETQTDVIDFCLNAFLNFWRQPEKIFIEGRIVNLKGSH